MPQTEQVVSQRSARMPPDANGECAALSLSLPPHRHLLSHPLTCANPVLLGEAGAPHHLILGGPDVSAWKTPQHNTPERNWQQQAAAAGQQWPRAVQGQVQVMILLPGSPVEGRHGKKQVSQDRVEITYLSAERQPAGQRANVMTHAVTEQALAVTAHICLRRLAPVSNSSPVISVGGIVFSTSSLPGTPGGSSGREQQRRTLQS